MAKAAGARASVVLIAPVGHDDHDTAALGLLEMPQPLGQRVVEGGSAVRAIQIQYSQCGGAVIRQIVANTG